MRMDAACMHGPTHNSGAVACIKNILHPSEVARLVMERTDHCLIVDQGAYQFARDHGHPHTDLMTEETRKIWMAWRESMSDRDDRLSPPKSKKRPVKGRVAPKSQKSGMVIRVDGEDVALEDLLWNERITGTIHCSALSRSGEIACTTTTSGLAWKIPGRVGATPIVGARLYCDQEVGSAGGTGRGESAGCVEARRPARPFAWSCSAWSARRCGWRRVSQRSWAPTESRRSTCSSTASTSRARPLA